MSTSKKDNGPKTTIWRQEASGLCLVKTIRGLPYGVPKMGAVIRLEEFGEAMCSGVSASGTAPNQTVTEVKFTVK